MSLKVLQGKLASVQASVGDKVKENQPLFVIEAMKMETTITAPRAGKIAKVVLTKGMVEQDDLVLVLE